MSWVRHTRTQTQTQTQASQTEPQTQAERAITPYDYGGDYFPRYNADLHEIRDNLDIEFDNANLAMYHSQHELSPIEQDLDNEINEVPNENLPPAIIQTSHSEHNYCSTQNAFVNFDECPTTAHHSEIRPDQMFNNQNSMITHSQAPSTSNLMYVNEMIRNRQEHGVWTAPTEDYTLYFLNDAEVPEAQERTAVLNLSNSSITADNINQESRHMDSNVVFRSPSPPPVSNIANATPAAAGVAAVATASGRSHSLETAVVTPPRHLSRAQPPPMEELSLSSASEAEYVQFANTRTTNTTTTTSAAKRKKIYANSSSSSNNSNNNNNNNNSISNNNADNSMDGERNNRLFSVSDLESQPSTSRGINDCNRQRLTRRRQQRHTSEHNFNYSLRNNAYSDDDEDEEVVAWNLNKNCIAAKTASANGTNDRNLQKSEEEESEAPGCSHWSSRRERERERDQQQFRIERERNEALSTSSSTLSGSLRRNEYCQMDVEASGDRLQDLNMSVRDTNSPSCGPNLAKMPRYDALWMSEEQTNSNYEETSNGMLIKKNKIFG